MQDSENRSSGMNGWRGRRILDLKIRLSNLQKEIDRLSLDGIATDGGYQLKVRCLETQIKVLEDSLDRHECQCQPPIQEAKCPAILLVNQVKDIWYLPLILALGYLFFWCF